MLGEGRLLKTGEADNRLSCGVLGVIQPILPREATQPPQQLPVLPFQGVP